MLSSPMLMPSKSISLLSLWISPQYLQKSAVVQLCKTFSQAQPFPYLELPDFFLPEIVHQVKEVLAQERLDFKEADLFTFFQTPDLISATHPFLRSFRAFLASQEFIQYLMLLSGQKLKWGNVDLAGTLYQNTHFLLCHDDRLAGRKLAFMIYLSTLRSKQGGALQLYASVPQVSPLSLPFPSSLSSRSSSPPPSSHFSIMPTTVAKKILPRLNTFLFFLVSDHSFHAVEEVIDADRWALSGWFHG